MYPAQIEPPGWSKYKSWHASQKNKKLKDGSLKLAFEVAGTKEIKTWILGVGSLAKVLEPAALVKEIKADLGKTLSVSRYQVALPGKEEIAAFLHRAVEQPGLNRESDRVLNL